MVLVFKEYRSILSLFDSWGFEALFDEDSNSVERVQFSSEELIQLKSWLCFCCNACIDECFLKSCYDLD